MSDETPTTDNASGAPGGAAEDAAEASRRRKHLEVTCRALADSVVSQLVASGCDAGLLIDFASEVLRTVTERGVKHNGQPGEPAPHPDRDRVVTVPFHCEPVGPAAHRIRGRRVTLRPLEPADAALLETWAAEGEIRATCSQVLLAGLLADLPAAAADPSRRDLVVQDETGRDIGMVNLFAIDPVVSQAEMAKLLGDPSVRGRGYAREATELLLAYAFTRLGLNRVYLRTAGFNLHNIHLNEKIGFRFEGILRSAHVLAGELIDVALMSMLREDYRRLYRLEPPR